MWTPTSKGQTRRNVQWDRCTQCQSTGNSSYVCQYIPRYYTCNCCILSIGTCQLPLLGRGSKRWKLETNLIRRHVRSFARPPACLPATLRTGTTCRSGRVRNGGKEQGTEVQCSVVPFAGNAALENIAHSYTNEFMFMGGSPFSE